MMAAANQEEGKLMLSKPRGKPNDGGSKLNMMLMR